jgi:hypothetical protein
MPRRLLVLGLVALLPAGCRNGELSLLGYSSAPPFDPNVRTVYIPAVKMAAFVATPFRGMEYRLSEALVQELNGRRTPMRVVGDPAGADTELVVTIDSVRKQPWNFTQQGLVREYELYVSAQVVWRDLRTGRVLSGGRGPVAPDRPVPFDPTVPPAADPPPPPLAAPTTVVGTGRTLVELGETSATGEDMALKNMAKQIVNMMETPW